MCNFTLRVFVITLATTNPDLLFLFLENLNVDILILCVIKHQEILLFHLHFFYYISSFVWLYLSFYFTVYNVILNFFIYVILARIYHSRMQANYFLRYFYFPFSILYDRHTEKNSFFFPEKYSKNNQFPFYVTICINLIK